MSDQQKRPRPRASKVASWVAMTGVVLGLGLVPSVLGGTPADPEISDAQGDAQYSAALLANLTLNQSVLANHSITDVVAAWIALEQRDAFVLFIQVKEIPNGWGLVAQPPADPPVFGNLSVASLGAQFNASGQTYMAMARLAAPAPGVLLANFTLAGPNGVQPISGIVDAAANRVLMLVPKAMIGSPADGSLVTKFYVRSWIGNVTMDFAPDAKNPAPGPDLLPAGSLEELLAGPRIPTVVSASYGRDYMLGQYPATSGGGGGGGGGASPRLEVTPSRTTAEIGSGEIATYAVTIRNDAPSADRIALTLNSAPDGWAHEIAEGVSEISLAAGASRQITLLVSANDVAAGQSFRSVLSLTSEAGRTASLSVLTIKAADADKDKDAQGGKGDEPASGGGIPGLMMPGLITALAAALVWARRRRAA